MHESPLAFAVSLTSLLTALSACLIAIFKSGKDKGIAASAIAELKYAAETAKLERDTFRSALAKHSELHAKYEIIFDAQGEVNALRERRENEMGQRVSRIEGQHERERNAH